jgi:hypothetical protein
MKIVSFLSAAVLLTSAQNAYTQSQLVEYQFKPHGGDAASGIIWIDPEFSTIGSGSFFADSNLDLSEDISMPPATVKIASTIGVTPYSSPFAIDFAVWDSFTGFPQGLRLWSSESLAQPGLMQSWGWYDQGGNGNLLASGIGDWEPVPVPEPSSISLLTLFLTMLCVRVLGKKTITLWLPMLTVACAAIMLAGCKPHHISGQVFIVTRSGFNMPLGAVEVDLVDATEAEDFLENRNAEIKHESDAINLQIKETSQQYSESGKGVDEARNKYLAAVRIEQDFERDEPFKTNEAYILLTKRYQGYATLLRAIDNDPTGGVRISPNSAPPDPNRRLNLEKAMLDVQTQQRNLQYSLASPIKESRYQAEQIFNQLSNKHSEIQRKLNDLRSKLNAVASPQSVFLHFDPHPIEKTITDAEGKFVINVNKKKSKLYAKAQRQILDETESYYWLTEIPSNSRVIILSNNNIFSAPTGASASH